MASFTTAIIITEETGPITLIGHQTSGRWVEIEDVHMNPDGDMVATIYTSGCPGEVAAAEARSLDDRGVWHTWDIDADSADWHDPYTTDRHHDH